MPDIIVILMIVAVFAIHMLIVWDSDNKCPKLFLITAFLLSCWYSLWLATPNKYDSEPTHGEIRIVSRFGDNKIIREAVVYFSDGTDASISEVLGKNIDIRMIDPYLDIVKYPASKWHYGIWSCFWTAPRYGTVQYNAKRKNVSPEVIPDLPDLPVDVVIPPGQPSYFTNEKRP
jgi:hypothetical protein